MSADERRRQRRRTLYFYPAIVDRASGEERGRLADLTLQGVLMVSPRPADVGTVLELRLCWDDDGRARTLDFNAEVRWSGPDTNPDFTGIGLAFVVPSTRVTAIIEGLIEDFGFQR